MQLAHLQLILEFQPHLAAVQSHHMNNQGDRKHNEEEHGCMLEQGSSAPYHGEHL